MEINTVVVGERLKNIRVDLGMTQSHVANDLNINQSMVSKIENGQVVHSDTLLAMLVYYGQVANISFLLSEEFSLANRDILYNKNKILASVAKEKLKLLREEFDKSVDDILEFL